VDVYDHKCEYAVAQLEKERERVVVVNAWKS